MKPIIYILFLFVISVSAHENEQNEETKNAPIHVNFNVSNNHEEHATNMPHAHASQKDNNIQTQVIIIKDERSLAKTALHAALGFGITVALSALSNSEKVARTIERIISQFS